MSSVAFDVIIVILVVVSTLMGFISGFVMQLASLLGLLCCAFFAGKTAELCYPFLAKLTGISPSVLLPLSYLLAFIIIMIVFYVLGKLLEKFIKAIQLGVVNRLLGSLFSVAKWLLLASILLNLLVIFDEEEHIIQNRVKENSLSYPYIKPLAPSFIPFLDYTGYSEMPTFK
ncbi:MAG: CvpA family protein [Prevotella sp.]|jgi:membrane protein required for colicin V production|nr:CvpA family protein [Prevotella sp.]